MSLDTIQSKTFSLLNELNQQIILKTCGPGLRHTAKAVPPNQQCWITSYTHRTSITMAPHVI